MAPSDYTKQQKKELVVKENKISLIEGQLYKMGLDEILRRYVSEHERKAILAEAHECTIGGHYIGKTTAHKILRAGFVWLTLHKYAKEYFRA